MKGCQANDTIFKKTAIFSQSHKTVQNYYHDDQTQNPTGGYKRTKEGGIQTW